MSSKRRIRRKMCTGKTRHDEKGAKAHCHQLWKKDGQKMRPYRCKFCKGWHVGHYNARKYQK